VRKKIEAYLEQAVIAEGGNVRYLTRQTIGFFKELVRRILFLLGLLFNLILKLLHIERKTKNEYTIIPDDEFDEQESQEPNSEEKKKDPKEALKEKKEN